jgi:hypothetical protein
VGLINPVLDISSCLRNSLIDAKKLLVNANGSSGMLLSFALPFWPSWKCLKNVFALFYLLWEALPCTHGSANQCYYPALGKSSVGCWLL